MKVLSKSVWVLILLSWIGADSKASDLLLSRLPNTSDLAQGLRSDQHYEAPGFPLQQAADRFLLETSSIITGISWWGFYLPAGTLAVPQQCQFRIRMFGDQEGRLSLSPAYDTTVFASVSPFMTVQGHPTYTFSAFLPVPFEAEMQTGYWFGVSECDFRTDGAFDWFNSGPAHWPIGFASRASDGDGWVVAENAERMSFTLVGSVVPEPSGQAVLVLGAVISLVLRWLRRLR